MKKFCRCGRFDPGLGDADQIWMVRVYETRQSGRVRVCKNGTDVESTDSEIGRARVDLQAEFFRNLYNVNVFCCYGNIVLMQKFKFKRLSR